MLDINRVLKEDRLLRALTGLNRKAFDELLEAFSVRATCWKRSLVAKSPASEPEGEVDKPDCWKLHISYFLFCSILNAILPLMWPESCLTCTVVEHTVGC